MKNLPPSSSWLWQQFTAMASPFPHTLSHSPPHPSSQPSSPASPPRPLPPTLHRTNPATSLLGSPASTPSTKPAKRAASAMKPCVSALPSLSTSSSPRCSSNPSLRAAAAL
ncbi:hypothetical protein M8818_003492 [Zalaria obscura]|uniref:Uncharacterized protein n=1 Tax=Zalaria obscura TaxID=2024903 RepID=A0ACC3SF08_9PEZI